MLQAHQYWRARGLGVDLVILNLASESKQAAAFDPIVVQARAEPEANGIRGRVIPLRAADIPQQTRALLRSAARVVIDRRHGSLRDQLDAASRESSPAAKGQREQRAPAPGSAVRVTELAPTAASAPGQGSAHATPEDLEFFNGLGGFAA